VGTQDGFCGVCNPDGTWTVATEQGSIDFTRDGDPIGGALNADDSILTVDCTGIRADFMDGTVVIVRSSDVDTIHVEAPDGLTADITSDGEITFRDAQGKVIKANTVRLWKPAALRAASVTATLGEQIRKIRSAISSASADTYGSRFEQCKQQVIGFESKAPDPEP